MPLPAVPAPPPPNPAAGLQPFLQSGLNYFSQTGDLQRQSALSNFGLQQQGSALQSGYLQGNAQDQLAQLGIQGANLGIQQGANARQAPLANAMFGLQNQSMDIQQGALQRAQGFDPKLHELTNQDIQAQRQDLAQQQIAESWGYGQQQQAAQGQMGVGGTSGGVAGNQAWLNNRLNHELKAGGPDLGFYGGQDKWSSSTHQTGTDLKTGVQRSSTGDFKGQHQQEGSFGRQASSLDRSQQREDIRFNEQMAQLQDSLNQLGIQRQELGLSHEEQLAQIRDRGATLDNMARSLGISHNEILRRLDYGLKSLGLSDQMNANQVVDQLTAIGQNQFSQTSNLIAPILQLGGLG